MKRRDFLQNTALCLLAGHVGPWAAAAANPEDRWKAAASKGRRFLTGLFDPTLGLLPEYAGSKVYWLYHDNYLAAKVLRNSDLAVSQRIEKAIRRHGITESGKIEIVFDEATHHFLFGILN